ncbi:MAG: ABC transporter ATP-binding protein [Oscillospiraceae bacterium]
MNKKINPLKELLLYCRRYAALLIIAMILGGACALFSVIGPNKIADMVDLIEQGLRGSFDLAAIGRIGIFLAVLYGLGWVFGYLQQFILTTVTQRMTQSLRTDISGKINRMPLRYLDNSGFGDILSRVTNDADTIGQMLSSSIGTLVSSVTLLVGTLIMMFVTNIGMAAGAVISSFIGFALLILLVGKSQKHFLEQQNALGKMDGYIEEMFSGQQVVRAYNGEEKAERDFDKINAALYESAWKSRFLSGLMMPIMSFVGNLGYVVVCVLGAVLTANGKINFSVIVSFMIYIRLFTQPLSQIAQVLASIQPAIAAGTRVFEFLNEEELSDESEKTKKPASVKGNVDFRHISFGYLPEKEIIHDFSADIKAGQKIAIVGHTGAGKTTIVNLLMRFYEVGCGEIRIDGTPIKDMKREDIRSLFCMVLQDTWIFEGTLRENLVYCSPNVPDERLNEVCKAVGLSHFVRTLPEGYDTVLNEQSSLSAGQKQLVTIARAMIKDAPLLILDEATSSVDTKTEQTVQRAMDALMENRTSFIIAHRLSTIRNADMILVMKNGDIVERGSHEELIMQNGIYAELYNSQFEQAE